MHARAGRGFDRSRAGRTDSSDGCAPAAPAAGASARGRGGVQGDRHIGRGRRFRPSQDAHRADHRPHRGRRRSGAVTGGRPGSEGLPHRTGARKAGDSPAEECDGAVGDDRSRGNRRQRGADPPRHGLALPSVYRRSRVDQRGSRRARFETRPLGRGATHAALAVSRRRRLLAAEKERRVSRAGTSRLFRHCGSPSALRIAPVSS